MPSLPSTYLSLLAFLLFSLPTLIFSIPLSNAILPTPQDPDNDTQNLTMSNSNCAPATTDQWTVPNWLVEDCFAAINNFYLKKIYNSNPSQPQEFLALKTPPQTSKAPVYTPAKLSTGTCTIAVVMIDDMRLHRLLPQLPGLRQKKGFPFPKSDELSWEQVWKGLRSVERSCSEEKSAGWIQMGMGDSVGVFIWATGSIMDDTFPNARPGGILSDVSPQPGVESDPALTS